MHGNAVDQDKLDALEEDPLNPTTPTPAGPRVIERLVEPLVQKRRGRVVKPNILKLKFRADFKRDFWETLKPIKLTGVIFF